MQPRFRSYPLRRPTREVKSGGSAIGGENPIRIQSMLTSDTMDTEACVKETLGLVEAGQRLRTGAHCPRVSPHRLT